MRKKERHKLIQQLVNDRAVEKQEDLVALLRENGVKVTQATISRDIKELHLLKVPAGDGRYRYSLPNETMENLTPRLAKLLASSFVAVDQMDIFVSLKTIPGSAVALVGLLEQEFSAELFTALTDDERILMIARSEKSAQAIKERIYAFI
ncbi:ArgR family transcriptional regulator [Enterococcus hirae]|jgi:transcriptional regulator of arginine metabolism|nr:ArgR family transcriptional regulator [Enterococcaceae bacterium]MCI1919123.1 ArgR family transcriptional regulator [Enterococcaceae bacterium]MDM8213533.1 ArgR family transcriptional regulator [Enterococcus hirae]